MQNQTTDNTKLEALNRAELDALGAMLQASHWFELANDAADKAAKVFLARERAWQKADRALQSHLRKAK